MTLDKLVGSTRRLIGSPSNNTVPEREIIEFLIPSIQWLAGHLKFDISTDTNISLVADQREYQLVPGLLYFVFVEINGLLLDPTSVWDLNSSSSNSLPNFGGSGQTWRTIPSGIPTRYACQGRSLILWPPATADFVAATPTMTWRYISSGAYFTTEGSVGLTPQGIPSLTDLDLAVVRYDAALAWLSAHMLGMKQEELPAIQGTIEAYKSEIARRLPECKRRWMDMQEDSHKTVRVQNDRFWAAR